MGRCLTGLWLAAAVSLGCGNSLSDENNDGGHVGEASGMGGSSGSSGSSAGGGLPAAGSSVSGRSSAGGGSSAGDRALGGSPAGGSAQGGVPSGGAAGRAGGDGQGGTSPSATRLLLQTGGELFATDPEGTEKLELCSAPNAQVLYDLVDWVDDRAIVFRRDVSGPTPWQGGEVLRVALDGSECTSLLSDETVFFALSPVVAGRVVLATNPDPLTPPPLPGGNEWLDPIGLASFPLDGSAPLAVLAPSGVVEAYVADGRVLFIGPGPAGEHDFLTALPDASSIVAPVPGARMKSIGTILNHRIIVNDGSSNDVYAVDTDGGNLAALAVGPDLDSGAGFVGARVAIHRATPTGGPNGESQYDIFSVDTNGGELTPLATSADGELLEGQIGDFIIYERANDLYTARLDGSDVQPLTMTPDVADQMLTTLGSRVLFSTGDVGHASYFSVLPDGTGLITLLEDASAFGTVAGDRLVFYVGAGNYDLVSVPLTGGERQVLADDPESEWLVGKLGTTLVIQRGERDLEAEVLRIDADGSGSLRLADSARYLGAVTEACGAVRRMEMSLDDCTQ